MTVPPLRTIQPLESMPSPSPSRLPVTVMVTVPPLTVVTETPSSLVLMPSSPEVMLMTPLLMVRCSSLSSPSFSAVMFKTPSPFVSPLTFMDILEYTAPSYLWSFLLSVIWVPSSLRVTDL